MMRRTISLLMLLLAGAAGLGAARAPALTITGPDVVILGDLATYTVQLSGLGADPPAGTAVVVTLPAGVTYAPDGEQLGKCTGEGTQVITCPMDEPADPLRWNLRTSFHSPTMQIGDQLTLSAAVGDLSATFTATVGPGADLAVTDVIGPRLPLIAGRPFRYTVVVHNYGPGTARYVSLSEGSDGEWFHGDGKIVNGPGDCFADAPTLKCDIPETLAPGEEIRIEHEMRTRADADTWGREDHLAISVTDFPGSMEPTNPDNNYRSLAIAFAPKPADSPSPSSSPSQPPAAGPGLPITGPPAGALTAAGAMLLLTGAALLGATRLRRSRP